MSGLGVTVAPVGEPGVITHPVPIQAETTPDQPAQIAQSTAIQTLDQLLHTNWIYDSTFTASTTMAAGTICYVKPIHPLEWNWPNRRVATMFNLWTGSGKIRYRPLATAWYGGSIRVGFLPPNLRMEDIQKMSLEVLTSFPNRDIDPKNTAWVDFRGPDQREIAYHYMKAFDDTDRQNFGGYIVFYVAGKLVTQAPEFTTIQFIVELAGDFMFDQPNPSAIINPVTIPHPLGEASNIPLTLQPLCDWSVSGLNNAIQVTTSSITALPAGGYTMSSVGLPKSLGKLPTLENFIPTRLPVEPHFACSTDYMTIAETAPYLKISNLVANINREYHEQINNAQVPIGTEYQTVTITGLNFDAYNDIRVIYSAGTATPSVDAMLNNDHIATHLSASTDPINVTSTTPGAMKLSPNVDGESIVLFVNVGNRAYAPQTTIIADKLGKFGTNMSESDTSFLYHLVNEAGTPLLLVRLNPNGIFTTSPVSTSVLYAAETSLYLKYFGTLPVSSPLPPATPTMRNLRAQLTRLQRGKSALKYTAQEIDLA